MKRISRWGRDHKWPARVIIIASFTLLTLLGMLTGNLLNDISISISSPAFLLFTCIYLAAVMAYPSKYLKSKMSAAAFYVRQKTCDGLLAASTFCMIVCLSNQPGEIFNYSASVNAAVPVNSYLPKDSTVVKKHKSIAGFAASLKDESGKSLVWKEKKKLLKEQVRAIKSNKEMSRGSKVALIILSVLVAAGLLALVLALACDLSCNGSEAAAILVGVGGTALIVFLLLVAIRAITGRKKKSKIGKAKPGVLPEQPTG